MGSPVGRAPRRRRASPPVGLSPLSPQRKWRAILVATLVLVPAIYTLFEEGWSGIFRKSAKAH